MIKNNQDLSSAILAVRSEDRPAVERFAAGEGPRVLCVVGGYATGKSQLARALGFEETAFDDRRISWIPNSRAVLTALHEPDDKALAEAGPNAVVVHTERRELLVA